MIGATRPPPFPSRLTTGKRRLRSAGPSAILPRSSRLRSSRADPASGPTAAANRASWRAALPGPVREPSTVGEIMAATNTTAGWWCAVMRSLLRVRRRDGACHSASADVGQQVDRWHLGRCARAQGVLDVEEAVTAYVPELALSGYRGATVRHLLDMRSGIAFSEDYLDPDAEVRVLEQAVGWAPRRSPHVPTTLRQFLRTLRQARPHGGSFDYRSCETDILGWVCEAAAHQRFPQLASALSGRDWAWTLTPISRLTPRGPGCSTAASQPPCVILLVSG